MNKQKILSIITIGVFIAIIFSFSIFFLINPKTGFSDLENREMQQFPEFNTESFLNGEFGNDINKYFSDQFPLRREFVLLKAYYELAFMRSENNNVLLGKNGELAIGNFAIMKDANYVYETDAYNIEHLQKEAEAVIVAKQFYDSFNIPFSVLIPPRKIDIASSAFDYPDYYSKQLMNDIDSLFADTGYINLWKDFEKRFEDGEKIYFKTDHHWTVLGAYYAYAEVMKSFDLEPLPLDSFEFELCAEKFFGTTYSKSGMFFVDGEDFEIVHIKGVDDSEFETIIKTTKEPIVFDGFYNREFLTQKDKYSAFLNGKKPLTTITKKNQTDRPKLLIFKDSFGHSLAPFLAAHFDLELVDFSEYFNVTMLISKNPDYVLYVNNVDFLVTTSFFENCKNFGKYIDTYRKANGN